MVVRRLALSATLLACVAAPAWSADDVINDVRGFLGLWPENYEAEGEDVGVDHAFRLGGQYIRSFEDLTEMGSLIYGGDGSLTIARGDDIDSTALVVTGHMGWGYQLPEMDQLHFEGTLFLGLGLEQVDDEGNDDMGPLIEYGLRVAGYYTFEDNWQAGLDLRYLIESSSSQDLGGGDFDYENDGVAILLGIGKRM